MKICICGYYYKEEFLQAMAHIKSKYEIHIIANKRWERDNIPDGIKVTKRENIGLEWGAYDFYLKNIWDGKSDVLFLHDDIRFRPIIHDYKFVGPTKIIDSIAKIKDDQVYFFSSTSHAEKNYYIHGRALKCSRKFLEALKENGGFPYDENNSSHTRGPTPKHCRHFNWADYQFADFIKTLNNKPSWRVGEYKIIPALDCATRGRFDNEIDGPIQEVKE